MGKGLLGKILGAAAKSDAVKDVLSGEGIGGEVVERVVEAIWEKIEPIAGEMGGLESIAVAAKKGGLPELILKGVSGAKKMLGVADALGGKDILPGVDVGALVEKFAGNDDFTDDLVKGLTDVLGEKLGSAVKVERK